MLRRLDSAAPAAPAAPDGSAKAISRAWAGLNGLVMMTPTLMMLLSVSAPAAPPAEVPWPSLDFTELQWLGGGPNGIAVRELRLPDIGQEKLCAYPGVAKLSEPEKCDEHNGATMITWAMPEVGEVVTPKVLKRYPVYQPGVVSMGCTEPAVANTALDAAKAQWKEQKIDFEKRVFTKAVWLEQSDVPFKGSCFKTAKSGKGCSLSKTGADVALNLKLEATSPCIKKAGDSFEPGCNAERLYSGTVTTQDTKKPFAFAIKALLPTTDTGVQNELRRIDVVGFESYQFVVFTFAPVFLSQREKTQVLLRIR